MAKNAKQLIIKSRKELRDFMRDNLKDIAASMIDQVMRSYRQLPPSRQIDAIKNVNPKGKAGYQSALKEALAIIAREAAEMVKKEVPARIKFGEFNKLPPKIRRMIEARAQLLIGAQIADLEKTLFFEFTNKLPTTDSANEIRSSMIDAGDSFINGPTISGGASSAAAQVVNTVRQAYFDEPDVSEQIQAYKYINEVPVSAICKDLQNHVFDKNDPDRARYNAPFHFNCDGYFVAILKTTKLKTGPSKFVPSKAAQESIQFSEGGRECGNFKFGELDLVPPKEAQSNAKRGLELRRKWDRGGTVIGVARARDISNGKNLSPGTIARMASFNRHRDNNKPNKKETDGGPTAGTIAWLLWGGDSGVDWAIRKMDSINRQEMGSLG